MSHCEIIDFKSGFYLLSVFFMPRRVVLVFFNVRLIIGVIPRPGA